MANYRIYIDKANEIKIVQYVGEDEEKYPLIVEHPDLSTVTITDTFPEVGDEYNPSTKSIVSRLDRRPAPPTSDLVEEQIQAEMRRLAVDNLKTKGILPTDFVDVLEKQNSQLPLNQLQKERLHERN